MWTTGQNCSLILLLVLLISAGIPISECTHDSETQPQQDAKEYTNEFAVHLEGGDADADRIALEHGFMNRGQVRKREKGET